MAALGHYGPFRPGTGAPPPYLAGREGEQALLRGLLEGLAEGEPPPSEVILYGPRGAGKTVLLRWLEHEADASPGTETTVLLPSVVPDSARLAELLLPDSWWGRLTPHEVEVAGFSWRPGRGHPPPLDEVVAVRARRRPFLLLLDEAHTLDLEVGRALLNTSQRVGRELPFLLVLAGTPNLRSHLNRMGVSFWNRAELVRVGRLSEEAAGAALRRPFEAEGVAVDEEALAAAVGESQCYPYFVQLLGGAIWRDVAGRGEPRVTRAALDRARPVFAERRGEYYLHRLDELKRRGLLAAGRAVAEAFRNSDRIGDPQFDGAIAAALPGDATPGAVDRAAAALSDLGFIWRVRARPEWEPGIPSLMDYVREFAPG